MYLQKNHRRDQGNVWDWILLPTHTKKKLVNFKSCFIAKPSILQSQWYVHIYIYIIYYRYVIRNTHIVYNCVSSISLENRSAFTLNERTENSRINCSALQLKLRRSKFLGIKAMAEVRQIKLSYLNELFKAVNVIIITRSNSGGVYQDVIVEWLLVLSTTLFILIFKSFKRLTWVNYITRLRTYMCIVYSFKLETVLCKVVRRHQLFRLQDQTTKCAFM